MQWIAIPRPWVDDEMTGQWTQENPAPDLLVMAMLCARIQSGAPWGKTKLIKWSGIKDWKARKLIKQATKWMQEQGHGPTENQPPYAPKTTENQPKTNHRPLMIPGSCDDQMTEVHADFNQKVTGLTRARSSTDTIQHNTDPDRQGQIAPVPAAQDKGIPKDDISTMWATMCGIRADVFPGSQRVLALLPARDQKLRACLRIQKLTPDDLVHLTRWFFTADENQWVRDKGYHFDTMLRPANVARYYEKAQGWSAARDEADTERRLAEGY